MTANSCTECKLAALFTEGLSNSAKKELAIDETASMVSLAPIICVVHEISVAVQEGEECVQEFLDHLSGQESAARHFNLGGEADDNDSFFDVMSGITAVGDADGCTFADALARANLSVETLTEGVVDTSRLPQC